MVPEGSDLLNASFAVRHWWAGWSQRVRGEAAVVLLARLANVTVGAVFVLLTARQLGPTGRGEIDIAFRVAKRPQPNPTGVGHLRCRDKPSLDGVLIRS